MISYKFSDISDGNTRVHRIDVSTGRHNEFLVKMGDQVLRGKDFRRIQSINFDLVDTACIIAAVDRTSRRKNGMRRQLRVIVPVRSPEIWNSPDVQQQLKEILHWLTEDNWQIDFVNRKTSGRSAEAQYGFHDYSVDEIALWSGGLDSLAGACGRLSKDSYRSIGLISSGSNGKRASVQRQLFDDVNRQFRDRVSLTQLPIRLGQTNNLRNDKNKACRTRGLVFMLLGSAYARIEGKDKLHIYENGIGAINLPFRPSDYGVSHSRSVHPWTMKLVSDLVSMVTGETFEITNPFILNTKAEMCEVFRWLNKIDLYASESCDRPPRLKGIRHCGYCSSCLLRRQSLTRMGADHTQYYLQNLGAEENLREEHRQLLYLMLRQANNLRNVISNTELNPWYEMQRQYASAGLGYVSKALIQQNSLPEYQIVEQLLSLYSRHIQELDSVVEIIGENILTEEEYHDYLEKRAA